MTTTPFHELATVIADEEKGAASKAIAQRIEIIEQMPDGPVRARIYAAAILIGGAELFANFEGDEAAHDQLIKLAWRFKSKSEPHH
jgi:hypothetical protein